MPHKITFQKDFLSIQSLDNTELPDFTLVTGINGSGKSHLLRAIYSGSIKSDAIAQAGVGEVSMFTWETLVPKDQAAAQPGGLSEIGKKIEEKLKQHIRTPHSEIDRLLSIIAASETVDAERFRTCGRIREFMMPNFSSARGEQRQNLQQQARLYINSLSDQNIVKHAPALFGENDSARHNALLLLDQVISQGFEQDLNRIFQRHRDLMNGNTIAEAHNQLDRIVKFNEPAPWDFLNELFDQGNIEFKVSEPDYVAVNSSVRVTLKKNGSDAEISFNDLSSGERIFISFAIALYNTESAKGTAVFPKLLLLDEIDATLHPSMVKYVLRVIKDTLVAKLGIKVIMTTHSPTTVALVDDDEVYEMNNQAGQLRPVGRSRALRLLTEAIPTLAIDYDARILVITEDESDAQIWNDLYRGLNQKLSSEKSLTFMGSGVKKETGETVGAGCARVRALTKQISEAGLNRVVGLVDWDNQHICASDDKFHILCEGERYSIENLILDPVLCILLMCKYKPDKAVNAALMNEDEGFMSLQGWSETDWQNKVNTFCSKVLSGTDTSSVAKIRYMNASTLEIPLAYLRHQGHNLEEKVLSAYPCFKAYSGQGKLLSEIVKLVTVGDAGEWYPASITTTMEALMALGADDGRRDVT
ncbi:hypothetical protein CEW89_05835 [Celeribacter ethanolicus]|uniref:AAA+ ATPase domain-containing protein n=1 Tax=Celeribacter ethanolicus TaxID=1758178 RepID=A0A291GAD0_9RHOB|nr:AAA family ATPase [Celeribacter ethanolicus]ATG47135.1 hypothetical protein CEW89_05835 [Celeribacter ethanolicus]